MGKFLSGEKFILHCQYMYDVMKARTPTIFTRDRPSKLLMATSKSSMNLDDYGSKETGEGTQEMMVQGGKV